MPEREESSPASIGKIVRQRRREMRLTQSDAAALSKVGTRFLSELENGKPTLHLGKVMQVLRAFGLQVELGRRRLTGG